MSVETKGLRIAEVDDARGLAAASRGVPDHPPNVVRLAVEGHDFAELRRFGLVVRPTWLHWVVPAAGGSTGLIGRQSRGQRQRTRGALRSLARLRMQISDPIDEVLFDEWTHLYEAQVGTMRHGHNFVAQYRAGTVASGSPFSLIGWRRDGRLVCGVVVRFDPEHSALVARFSAVPPGERGRELPRAMYATLADMAAARGMRWLSLGNDINFYGTVCKPGLCAFKLRLGFRPVPGDLLGNSSSRTVAEQVTSLAGLELPVLRFGYRRMPGPQATLDDFVDGPDDLELVSVAPPGETNEVLESLPPHRRLVLAG